MDESGRVLENFDIPEGIGFPSGRKGKGFPRKSRFPKISRTWLPFLDLLYDPVEQPIK